LQDPKVRSLARSVILERQSPEIRRNSVTEIDLRSGDKTTTIRATDWRGASTKPFEYTHMAEKFRRYANRSLTSSAVESVVQFVKSLESASDVAPLAAMMKGR
jgi:hypothetical protein